MITKIYSGDISLLNKIIIDNIQIEPCNEYDMQPGKHIVKYDFKTSKIPQNAFNDCDNITTITIPDGYTEIEEKAFYNCDNLKTVHIPDTVNKINKEAFYDCDSLKYVRLPENIDMDETAFSECEYKDSLTHKKTADNTIIYTATKKIDIDKYTLCNTNVYSHNFANGTGEIICEYTITTIDIPYGIYFKSINIPPCVTEYHAGGANGDYNMYIDVTTLLNINIRTAVPNHAKMFINIHDIEDLNTKYLQRNNFSGIGDFEEHTILLNRNKINTIEIANNITTIPASAFRKFSVSKIIVPSSVITIGDNAFSGLPSNTEIELHRLYDTKDIIAANDGTKYQYFVPIDLYAQYIEHPMYKRYADIIHPIQTGTVDTEIEI